MSARTTASAVADWLIAWSEQMEAERSHLKIQKLLYYAQGHHLHRYGTPLFDDPMEAWAHGPVVPRIYHLLKGHGSADCDLIDPDSFDWDTYGDELNAFLVGLWEAYAPLSAWALREQTHTEAPWRDAWEQGGNTQITTEAIKTFFDAVAA